MATYKDLVGTAIRNNAGNIPTAETGQVFYDSTNIDFKYQFNAVSSSWRTEVSLGSARYLNSGAGTASAAIVFGGEGPPNSEIGNTEVWDGTGWTEVNDLNTARLGLANSIGTSTSSLAVGGSPARSETEEWNGSNWTEVADLNLGRQYFGASGANTESAIVFGGIAGPSSSPRIRGEVESWNGSAWTETSDLNTDRRNCAGSGKTYTAALAISGGVPPGTPLVANVEEWNGSAWTEVNDVNTARGYGGASGESTTTLFYGGGSPSNTAVTETWNGTSWSETADLSTARHGLGSAGV